MRRSKIGCRFVREVVLVQNQIGVVVGIGFALLKWEAIHVLFPE